jgi:2-(1,2-epoxy-1,2-dihydrophenyl)acetyl-CoA isomerase
MGETIIFESGDGIATLTLNRPEKLNAFTVRMHEEIAEALSIVERDASLRALLLTGAGRGFCAGQIWRTGASSPRAARSMAAARSSATTIRWSDG